MKNLTVVEGTIPFKGYQTWYRRAGSSKEGKLPLLVLHGGPGFPHTYMESLDDIAENGREVVYYDQIGCGNSPATEDPDFYSIGLFEEELTNVIKELDLKAFHILGQSWGGMLLLDYMITQKPQGVKSIVVSSAPASIPLLESEINRLVSWLPPDAIAAIEKGMKEGRYDAPDFQAASNIYYNRHVVTLDTMPDYVAYSFEHQSKVYAIMQGYTEFMVIGKLKSWDVTERLHEITEPTLLISGVSDEITPFLVKQVYDGIPRSEWHLLPGTHLIHAERRNEYNQLVEAFLSKQEAAVAR